MTVQKRRPEVAVHLTQCQWGTLASLFRRDGFALVVEIALQAGGIEGGARAVLRHGNARGPENAIEDEGALAFVAPALVQIGAREAEAARTVRPRIRPGDHFIAPNMFFRISRRT